MVHRCNSVVDDLRRASLLSRMRASNGQRRNNKRGQNQVRRMTLTAVTIVPWAALRRAEAAQSISYETIQRHWHPAVRRSVRVSVSFAV